MHQANGDYDMNETRHLYRIMIAGEPVIAAEPAAAVAARTLSTHALLQLDTYAN
jgi:hypothetical protein